MKFNLLKLFKKDKREIEKVQKVTGYSCLEVLSEWVNTKFPKEIILVLADINVVAKPVTYWRNFPRDSAIHFCNDYVVIRPKDLTEAKRICENITEDFAKAYVFNKGELVDSNT